MLTKLFSLAKIGSKVNAQQYEASIFLFEVLQIVMCRILYCFQKLDTSKVYFKKRKELKFQGCANFAEIVPPEQEGQFLQISCNLEILDHF